MNQAMFERMLARASGLSSQQNLELQRHLQAVLPAAVDAERPIHTVTGVMTVVWQSYVEWRRRALYSWAAHQGGGLQFSTSQNDYVALVDDTSYVMKAMRRMAECLSCEVALTAYANSDLFSTEVDGVRHFRRELLKGIGFTLSWSAVRGFMEEEQLMRLRENIPQIAKKLRLKVEPHVLAEADAMELVAA